MMTMMMMMVMTHRATKGVLVVDARAMQLQVRAQVLLARVRAQVRAQTSAQKHWCEVV